jgi:hypothetical protein
MRITRPCQFELKMDKSFLNPIRRWIWGWTEAFSTQSWSWAEVSLIQLEGRNCARILDKREFSVLRDCNWLLLVICARSRYELLLVCFMIHDSKDLNLHSSFFSFFSLLILEKNCLSILKLVEAICRTSDRHRALNFLPSNLVYQHFGTTLIVCIFN